jgi:hypothetical protein
VNEVVEFPLDPTKLPNKYANDGKIFLGFKMGMSNGDYFKNIHELNREHKIKIKDKNGQIEDPKFYSILSRMIYHLDSDSLDRWEKNQTAFIERTNESYYDFNLGNGLGTFESKFSPEFTEEKSELKALNISVALGSEDKNYVTEIYQSIYEMYLEKYGKYTDIIPPTLCERYHGYIWYYSGVKITINIREESEKKFGHNYSILVKYEDTKLQNKEEQNERMKENKKIEDTKHNI